jgi:signal transduction histidine kinase
VLVWARVLCVFGMLPPLLAMVPDLLSGEFAPVALTQSGVLLFTAVWLWWRLDAAPAASATMLSVCLGFIMVTGLLQYGPVLGNGVLVLTWCIAVVFLHGVVFPPPLIATGVLVILGIAGEFGLLGYWEVPYERSQWLRTSATAVVLLLGVSYLFHRLLFGLGEALSREATARQAEAEARREREEVLRAAEQTQRLEAIGRLAGGVAHDFNNALTVFTAGLEVLEEADEAEREEVIGQMREAARGAEATTRQLLSLSRQGLAPGGATRPREALAALVGNLRRLLPETILVETDFEDTPEVAMTAGEFQQAVLNLCLNARDAMPAGGTLRISCATAAPGLVVVRVVDEGLGMDEETQRRALEPFFTTKAEGRGTGLGLAMVERQVRAVGGRIAVDSAVGRGTAIEVLLPVARPVSKAEGETPPASAFDAAGRSVLLLEDEPAVLAMIARALRRAGFEVEAVARVAAALAALERRSFDLLVTDAVLPDGNPAELVQRFRAQRVDAPVLVCSGYIGDEFTLAGVDRGDYAFLQKPFTPARLIGVLGELGAFASE